MNHRKSKNKCVIAAASLLLPTLVHAQSGAASSVDPVSIASDTTEVMLPDQHINEVTITKRQTVRSMGGAINGQAMLKGELFKCRCCPSCCPTSAVRLLPLPWATSLDLG